MKGAWCHRKANGLDLFLLGMMPTPSGPASGTSRRACHHSSSLALVTWRMSPWWNIRPRPGSPLSFDGSQSNSALHQSTSTQPCSCSQQVYTIDTIDTKSKRSVFDHLRLIRTFSLFMILTHSTICCVNIQITQTDVKMKQLMRIFQKRSALRIWFEGKQFIERTQARASEAKN